MAQITIGGGVAKYANGSSVAHVTTATSDGATPPNLTAFATAYTITPGNDGNGGALMPPDYSAANYPGATILAVPPLAPVDE